MSSFKKLSKSDVTVVPYHANKQWDLFYCPYPTSSDYITIYQGTNLTGSFSLDNDLITEGQYERLVYTEINHLFYQNYSASLDTSSLMNSLYYESASQQRPTSSYFIYNDNPNLIKSFPTGAMESIRVLAINQDIYSNKVLPYHFQLSSSVYFVTDDGYGNLFDLRPTIDRKYFVNGFFDAELYFADSGSEGGKAYIGNIFYAHGLAVITNQDYQFMFPQTPIAKNNSGSFVTTNVPKVISASLNDYARSGTLNTSSLSLSGSTNGPQYSWATSSNGTVILTTTTPGTYTVYYTIGADIAGSCSTSLRSNKAKITAYVNPECYLSGNASQCGGIYTITLTAAGANTGPFDIYTNADRFCTPVRTNISKSSLLGGYNITSNFPSNATVIRIKSTGTCLSYVDLSITNCTTTTTTTTTTTSTTTTTTTLPPGETTTTTTTSTTTTTTTLPPGETTTTTTTTTTTSTTTTTTTQANIFFVYENGVTGDQTWGVFLTSGIAGSDTAVLNATTGANAQYTASVYTDGPLGITSNITPFYIYVRKTSNSGNMLDTTAFDLYIDNGSGWGSPVGGFSLTTDDNPIGPSPYVDVTSNFGNPTANPGNKIKIVITEG